MKTSLHSKNHFCFGKKQNSFQSMVKTPLMPGTIHSLASKWYSFAPQCNRHEVIHLCDKLCPNKLAVLQSQEMGGGIISVCHTVEALLSVGS
jgi:hypothetical protein